MRIEISKYFAMEFSEPNELVELISDDDKVDFMQSLSCHEVVFNHVAEQIINGCTKDGYSACIGSVESTPSTSLQSAIRCVAKGASDVAKSQIEELESKLKRMEELNSEWKSKYYDIYHSRRGDL
jgi:hypothetical protein